MRREARCASRSTSNKLRNTFSVAQDTQIAAQPSAAPSSAGGEHAGSRLGAFLCWAVVFADIGTSVYYTPGILYGQVGSLAGLFVTMTMVVFVLLTLKYAEVSVRFPEGGGVVTVSARGINPWAGAVGGMFILVDYFLTSAISSLSGVEYFASTFFPDANIFALLVVTLVVVGLLGVLNWWGIKESAAVSAIFAVAAFLSDIAILVLIFASISLSQIGEAIGRMFQGNHLSGVTLLTGYAGAFLAFSGLESISQLSPVMKIPRSRTVTVALGLVAITVGITSPLLTFFSTTLLSTPDILAHQNSLISVLGFHVGGRVLEIATTVTASTLLIFASNTAIIGAYHVFLALSRMQFFPQVVEKHNRLRGTPHVSIILATGIPMAVLIAVRGDVTTLGDMYAFGLLGAFSLTCIALDFIRWRERHGEDAAVYGADGHNGHDEAARVPAGRSHSWPIALRARAYSELDARLSPAAIERLTRIRARSAAGAAAVGRRARPAMLAIRGWWPDLRYYLGFLTTFLVVIAWATNLINKPLATAFGGSLTVLGVGISVINYRRRQRAGAKPVFPMAMLRRIPDSVLVVLSHQAEHNEAVIRAAVESADGNTLVFMYLGRYIPTPLQPLAINDPYFRDDEAKRIFSYAAGVCARERIASEYIYRMGGAASVLDVWRIIRPDEIIAEAPIAKTLSKQVSPEYVRFQQADGVKVAHYFRHHVSALDTPDGAGTGKRGGPPSGAQPAARPPQPAPRPSQSAPAATGGKPNIKRVTGTPSGAPRGLEGTKPAPESRDAREAREPAAGAAGPIERKAPPAGEDGVSAPANSDIDDYVWTGTRLVRRSEVEQTEQETEQENAGKDNVGDDPET